jgi:small subunit ribosomal protein S7
MPRKYKSLDHLLRPDPFFRDLVVAKFIHNIMRRGKKSLAERIFLDALKVVERRVNDVPPVEVLKTAIENCKPRVEIKSRRVGGATYQIPVPIKEKRQLSLAIKWMLGAARERKGKPMSDRLADEILAAYRGEGAAIKKRDDVHKMAEANRAFAHLAF